MVELGGRGRWWCRRAPGPAGRRCCAAPSRSRSGCPSGRGRPRRPTRRPRQTASTARSAEQTASTSTSGRSASEPVAVDVAAGLEELGLLAVETTPTLTNSSRSTRGTQRSTTYWNGIRRSCRTRHREPGAVAARPGPAGSRRTPRAGRPASRRPATGSSHSSGTRASTSPSRSRVTCGASSASASGTPSRCADEHVVGGVVGLAREPLGRPDAAGPAVVEVQAGAVVDGPQVAVPHQQVGVAPGAVDVRGQRVEPQHRGRDRRGRACSRRRTRTSRAGSRRRG